jgi:hypothetical protein
LAAAQCDKNQRMAKTASPTTSMTNSTPTHDEIAAQAYQIYLREGCVEGRDMDHWLRAEQELRQRSNGNGHHAEAPRPSSGPVRVASKPDQTPAAAVLPNSVVPPTAAGV